MMFEGTTSEAFWGEQQIADLDATFDVCTFWYLPTMIQWASMVDRAKSLIPEPLCPLKPTSQTQ